MCCNKLWYIDETTFKGLVNLKEIWLHNQISNFDNESSLKFMIEKSVEFVSFKSGQDEYKPLNDIQLIINVRFFFKSNKIRKCWKRQI